MVAEDDARRFWAFVDRKADHECWEWKASRDDNGYGFFSLADGTATRMKRAHRVSWEIHNRRKIPSGLMCLHSCDNPPCVNPHHLRVGTAFENSQDARERNRLPRIKYGEENYKNKIPESVARTLRSEWKTFSGPLTEFCKNHGTPYHGTWRLLHGKSWRWL